MDPAQTPAPADPYAAVGLQPGTRYRCEGCGNLTRFDVRVTERGTRFWHVAVSGEGQVESTDDHQVDIEGVTCRWCRSSDRIVVEKAPLEDPS